MRCLNRLLFVLIVVFSFSASALFADDKIMEPEVFILSPADGDVVKSPVVVKFGLRGMHVVPAGVDKPNSGHHHLLVDVNTLPNLKAAVPADKQHLHFGKGQTETTLTLKPGKHTLQLLFADKNHVPHSKPLISKKITITVK